jgi:hypothetical protein
MKLAGNAVLGSLVRMSSFVESLMVLCQRSGGSAMRAAFTKVPEIAVNALLTEVPDLREVAHDPGLHPVALKLFGTGDEREAPWLYARTMVHIFFSGLGFLVGLLARRHIEGQQRLVVYLGGRGASMLCWVTAVRERRAAIIADAVRAGVAMQPAAKADVQVVGPAIYPVKGLRPKDEVAAGLLAGSGIVKPAAPQDTTVLGEGLWDSRSWDTALSLEELRQLEFPRTLDHGYMGAFLNQYLPRSAAGLGLDEANLAGLTRVDTSTVEQLLAADDAALQPVFAYELKAVMDQYAKMLRVSVPG